MYNLYRSCFFYVLILRFYFKLPNTKHVLHKLIEKELIVTHKLIEKELIVKNKLKSI